MKYDTMMHILQDDLIKEDFFIEFVFDDGSKGAVRKNMLTEFVKAMRR